jgi:hypothetical protein
MQLIVVPRTKTQEDAEVGTAAGATDIAGQRAVLPGGGNSEGTGDCPWAGALELGDGGSGSDAPVLLGFAFIFFSQM